MTIIANEQIICADIDSTLLMWGDKIKKHHKVIIFRDPYTNELKHVRVNEPNLKVLTSRLSRGATALVWSASGYKWVQAALKALKLDSDNIYILSKPLAYIDDKKCDKWMGEQIYLDPDDGWK